MNTTRRTATQLIAAAMLAPTAGTASAGPTARSTRDVVVVGSGVFGTWTAHALRAEGATVTLIDAYGPGNSRSSSGGESRITRSAYGDQEIYARWAQESLPAWKALQQRSGVALFENTGVLTIVPPATPFVEQTTAVLARLGIRHERLSAADTMRRFPQFHLDADESAIFEPDSGALMARRAVQTLAAELVASGVTSRIGRVRPVTGSGTLAAIQLEDGQTVTAGAFVFACGPWLPKVLPSVLGGRIHAQRAEVFFLGPPAGDPRYQAPAMPTWIDNGGVGGAYGFPSLDGRGCKVAVDSIDAALDPDTAERTVTAPYVAEMRSYVAKRFPGIATQPIVETRVCQYEMAADENYLLDRHPDFENVWIAGGGSGHGFKNGPAVGRYVAKLVTTGARTDPRFSVRPTPRSGS